MASLRFPTVSDLYGAFPTAKDDVGTDPGNEPPLTFLQSLVEKNHGTRRFHFVPIYCRGVRQYGGAASRCDG